MHVHGLGYDTAAGVLYIATHTGLFELPDGASAPTRIGDSHQDTMGFALVEPGHFLGSGHPDARENLPPHLGLIRSTDDGAPGSPSRSPARPTSTCSAPGGSTSSASTSPARGCSRAA